MTDQPGAGKSFGMSGDAKERHLTDIRRMTSSPPPARSSTRVWLAAAACLAVLALVGGVLAWRWAAAPGDVENFTVRCQFPGASKMIQTTTLLSPQDAILACGEVQQPGQGITLADGQLPVTCVEASTRIVVLDGSGACPTGSTRD
jgi:hypothetical protein